jgi:uncharacterized protein YigE (DUF2233 family)
MKKVIFVILLGIALGANAQTFKAFYPTDDVGFGKSSKVSELMPWVVNGMIFDGDYSPTGGYIDNGVQKKDWTDPETKTGNFATRNGIFGKTKAGKMILISYEDLNSLPVMQWAFQNGPILIRNSINVCNAQSTSDDFRRSGIGYRNDGSLVVVVAIKPCTPWTLAEELKQQGCIDAIYLDGANPTGYAIYMPFESVGLDPSAIKLQFFTPH